MVNATYGSLTAGAAEGETVINPYGTDFISTSDGGVVTGEFGRYVVDT